MKTALIYGALGLLGFFPVLLVLSVWDDDDPEPAVVRSAEEEALHEAQFQSFALNRDGCELALRQVEMYISRKQGGADLALEQCSVATTDTPPEWVARGQAKFLGARRWDQPVEFSVWFVEAAGGRYAACAIHLGQQGRAPVRKPHSSCASWTRRS